MTTDANDLKIDRPIEGAKFEEPYKIDQLTAAQFLAEIDSILETPGVTGLVWEQYTPYFNDGDPCEFSLSEVRLLTAIDDDPDHDRSGYDYSTGLSTYDLYDYSGASPYKNPDETAWRDFNGVSGRVYYDLLRSINTSSWQTVALANFGDHAEVTATAEGFNVEFYEHD